MLLSPIYKIIDIRFSTRTCGQIKEIVAYDLFLEFVVPTSLPTFLFTYFVLTRQYRTIKNSYMRIII